ncbi:hypothetical protein F0342_07050 [Bacillus sp. CH30_1T]|uniref:hypothetical protein n=1 Tax=Bacillus sp. CH30_1T TaxID=2604836 RepID=UPI00125C569D|nr:hypothetical protein [Bacillus sp. CH30_1T]KAA0565358.1 hypothetical protein F0342_07050 [Bacillus sp. CH30_1T]
MLMIIKKEIDVKHFIVHFSNVADGYDQGNQKYYLVVSDEILEGEICFMLYPFEGKVTYHRRNKQFCDWKEIDIDNDVLWNYRKLLNRGLKKLI